MTRHTCSQFCQGKSIPMVLISQLHLHVAVVVQGSRYALCVEAYGVEIPLLLTSIEGAQFFTFFTIRI